MQCRLISGRPCARQTNCQLEWDHLIEVIRQDKPFNEVKRDAEASLVILMGRRALHTGQLVTYEDMLN